MILQALEKVHTMCSQQCLPDFKKNTEQVIAMIITLQELQQR